MKSIRLLCLLSALVLVTTGCPRSSDPDDKTPTPDAGLDDEPDAGLPDAGDLGCRADTECATSEYCRIVPGQPGECLPAKTCRDDADCDYQPSFDNEDYCAYGSCYCDTDRGGGTCRPRVARCKPCERDIECGSDRFIYQDYVGGCYEYQGESVCLPNRDEGPCGPGYVRAAGESYCVPGGGSCDAAAACTRDTDCDPMSDKPVCDESRGFCVAACVFDYSSGTSPTCPGGQVCHVDPRLLTAQNPNFGGGECGPPCGGEGGRACGATLACEADGDPLLVQNRPERCRPPAPKCVRNEDCPQVADSFSHGYCDPGTLSCSDGCRRNSDCFSGYACEAGRCSLMQCAENGGAIFACQRGDFCCGEVDSPTPCSTDLRANGCYAAPPDVWCGDCNGQVPTPGGAPRPQPSKCVTITNRPQGGSQNVAFHACDPEKAAMCPDRWLCKPFIQFCNSDADCGSGGKCGDIQVGGIGNMKSCLCADGATCPGTSTCKQDDDGNNTYCEAYWCDLFHDQCLPPQEQ